MNKTIKKLSIFFLISISTLSRAASDPNKKIKYPKAPTSATVDTYFGHKVADSYRPLENDTAQLTLKWVNEENAITQNYLKAIPFRNKIKSRLSELNNYSKIGIPSKEADGKYYWYENDGLKNQAVLYRSDSYGGEKEVFLDPNTFSEDGTVALTGVYMSPDGSHTAYTISRSGSDWAEIFVIDTKTKHLLSDHINWAKFTSAEWLNNGFFYSAYSSPEKGKEFSNSNEFQKIYFHQLGTPQEDDILVFEDKSAPLHFHRAWVPENGKILAVMVSGQGTGNGLLIKNLNNNSNQFVTIRESQDFEMSPIDVIDNDLLVYTSKDAPNYRVVRIPLDNPSEENWVDVIPESDNVLVNAQLSKDYIIASYFKNAASHAEVYNLMGEKLHDVTLPGYGTASFATSKKHPEVFLSFSSFTSPSTIYEYDIQNNKSNPIRSTVIKDFDADNYITEQVWYNVNDSVRVPMFLTYKKGLQKNGKNPVYLYGYGGFNISLNPTFSPNRLFWLENGGIYAQANLRGGGEFGENWHMQGTKMNKQNVFDDFIAAAEFLIDEGWTNPDLLTIEGGSNGGLLVGAVTNQRPELFRVAIPRVGVMDMMRYHLFTIGWNWAPDYGTSADSPEMAEYLLKYSPVHNIKDNGTSYPAILVTTADHDDRVVPAHSFKYAAKLQASNTGKRPKLIRIDSNAGHGAGKPVSKTIDEWTDIYSFILFNLGLKY